VSKNLVAVFVLAGACFLTAPKTMAQAAPGQQPAANAEKALDQDVQLLRQDVRSKKKQLIAANLTLTEAESTKFWPVYDQYTADLMKINDQKYALIKEYAGDWGTMTNEQALSLLKRSLAVDEQVTQLRNKYVPIFNKVVGGKTVATFFQLDRRIQTLLELQLASQIPLVQAQE
jgi:Spy/CpxP family protein refolding chaperone